MSSFKPTCTNTPVSVESAPALITHVLSEDRLEAAKAPDGADISNHSHHHHRGGLDDGDGLHLLPLGHL